MYSVADRDGDLFFYEGELVTNDRVKDIKYNLLSIFNTRKGEFFLDSELGLDYTALEDKGSSNQDIEASILNAIEQEERITGVESIVIDRDTENRSVSIDIELRAGDEEISMEGVMLNVWS